MISNKDAQAAKALPVLLDIFTPPGATILSKVGLFTGQMPDLRATPSITQPYAITPAQLFADLGILQAQFLGCINFTSAANRKPTCTLGKNLDGTYNRKLNINFSNITSDLIGTVAGTPTFFVAMKTSAAGTDASSWAAMVSGTNLLDVIIGSVGDEDSNADLKLVGGKIVVGQGYRFTDFNIQF